MLPGFPEAPAPAPTLSESLTARGVSLRAACASDLPFLHDLHASFRAAELAFVPWPPERKRAFLDDQFRLQHIHFMRFHAEADFWVVLGCRPPGAPRPIGRLYLDRSGPVWRIVDIGFLPEARGEGLGSAMLDWIKAGAAANAASVALHVAANNPGARALYLRAGFVDDGAAEQMHQPMLWQPLEM